MSEKYMGIWGDFFGKEQDMIELRANDWYSVTGRGQMASVNLREVPGCPERIGSNADIPLEIGQRIRITDRGVFEIGGIECARALVSPPFIKPNVCLQLRPVTAPANGEPVDMSKVTLGPRYGPEDLLSWEKNSVIYTDYVSAVGRPSPAERTQAMLADILKTTERLAFTRRQRIWRSIRRIVSKV